MCTRTICLLLLLICPFVAGADELTAQKREDIRQLMVSTGGSKIAMQFAASVTQNLSKALKAARPDVPERVFSIVNSELIALFEERLAAPGGMIERVIPIYDKYFTHAEVRELLAFYRTPIGRRAIEVLPKVVGESMAAGQAWGKSLEPEINRRIEAALKQEGIELPRR